MTEYYLKCPRMHEIVQKGLENKKSIDEIAEVMDKTCKQCKEDLSHIKIEEL